MIGERIPWHPAFFEAIQKELEEYKDILEFKAEHALTDEPLRTDVLIIKKRRDVVIKKNIATIFRTDNIVEYKSPDDYASVNDLYKLYSYVYLHTYLNKLNITDLSLTIVETVYPRRLIKHFKEIRKFSVNETYSGIYVISGEIFPIQIIESKKLSPFDNLWLKHLSNHLKPVDLSSIITEHSSEIKESRLSAYMYAILHANQIILKEATNMSIQKQGLRPLEDVIDEMIAEGYFKRIIEKYESIRVDETKLEVAEEMFKENYSIEEIAKITKLSKDVLSELLQKQ